MKTININDYNVSMGKLINVDDKQVFMQSKIPYATNIEMSTLLYNRDRLLNKNETYYIYCQGGRKSKRVVNVLDAYGFKVVQVVLNK